MTVNGNFNDVALEKDGSFLFLLTGQLTHVSAAYVYDAGFKGLFEQNYSSVVVQADGGILMGGGGDSSFVVGHIPPPGGVQQFGTSGVATFPADTAQLNKLVVQPDGRVLAIGKSGGFFGAILRFWP